MAEKKEEGDWAWLKLHAQARPEGTGLYRLTITNPDEGYEVQVLYALASNDAPKFARGGLSFNCPGQLN